jgi:hypothetical protein
LEKYATDFILNQDTNYQTGEEVELSESVESRLEELGYK